MTDMAARLAADTLALVQIASESRDEHAIIEAITPRLATAPGLSTVEDHDTVLVALPKRRPGYPLLVLAGHVDTVARAGAGSATVDGGLAFPDERQGEVRERCEIAARPDRAA